MLTNRKNQHLPGIFLAFLFCLTSSTSYILISSYEQHFEPLKLLFYNFLLATIFFFFLSLRKINHTIALSKTNFSLVALLNIVTAISWICTFYSLKYIDPSVVIAIIFGIIPIVSVVFALKQNGWKNTSKQDVFFSLLILCATVIIICYYIIEVSAAKSASLSMVYFSLFLSIICGIGSALSVMYMKSLSTQGFSTIQVISFRFLLLIIFAAILILYYQISFSLTGKQFLEVGLLTIVVSILPIFFLQKSVEYTTSLNISFILPLQPVMTYLIQLFEGRIKSSLIMCGLISILSGFIFVSAFFKAKQIYQKK